MSVLLYIFLAAATAIVSGLLYQRWGLRRDARLHPPPGRVVACGTTPVEHLHVFDQGNGQPTVVLEAGIAGSLLGWAHVQQALTGVTRVLSYDRAGLGWSAKPQTARTLLRMLDELHATLRAVNAPAPYLLVGHSFGGLLARAFAHRWPELTAGLVLVDPVGHSSWAEASPERLRMLRRGADLSRRGAALAQFGVVRGALASLESGRRLLPKIVSRASAGRGSLVLERLVGEVRALPAWTHPKIRAHWSDARCFRAMADYLQAMPTCAAAAVALAVPSSVDVTVLSAGSATPQELAERDRWVQASARGKHIRVAESTHWIQIQRPDIVIEATREMVERIRSEGRMR